MIHFLLLLDMWAMGAIMAELFTLRPLFLAQGDFFITLNNCIFGDMIVFNLIPSTVSLELIKFLVSFECVSLKEGPKLFGNAFGHY